MTHASDPDAFARRRTEARNQLVADECAALMGDPTFRRCAWAAVRAVAAAVGLTPTLFSAALRQGLFPPTWGLGARVRRLALTTYRRAHQVAA